jgi:PAS domain S-box-containing protein
MRPRVLSVAAILFNPISICIYAAPTGLAPLLTSERSPRHDLYMAHPWLMWINVVPDVLIFIAYALLFTGVCLMTRKLRKIDDIRSWLWVINSFRIFILASGLMVLVRVLYIWFPLYQFALGLKVICALASVPTAIIFARQAPSMSANIHRFFDLLASEQSQGDTLRKSQEFLDRTGKIAGIGGWEVDLEKDEVTWSAETYRIHGAPLDYKPTLQEGLRMYAPEARPTIIAAVLTASAGGPGWDLELPVIRMDGRRIMVRSVGEVDFRDGKPVRLLGAFQDITDQIAARAELYKANERVSLATESGGIGIFDWDIKQDLCAADPWMHRLYGLEPPGCATPLEYWAAPMHPEDRPNVIEALEDAMADRRPYDTEFRVIWKDGSIHHIRATARVTRDEFGTPTHIIGVNWDVTESRRLTAELAEQHELLRVTLQSIGDGVITTDVRRNVSWLNPVAERMTGWTTAEACGRPLLDIFNTLNAENREPIENPVANFAAQGNVVGVARQTVLISREGNEFGIENQAAPIRDGNGELIGNILVFRDVTEQRRLAAETEHVTKLQLELKTKDEFLSHVSHELRSPLTSIYSFTSIIVDGLAGETTPEQTEYLQIILKNVVQLQSMIEDLLTVTQTREGKLSIELQSVAPCDAIRDAVHTLSSAATTKQITLSATEASDLPPACADPTRLRQILIILLDNAIKFTPPNGSVTVSVSQTHQDRLLFQVTDTGCGIPEEKRTLVFENLYQITGPAAPDTSQMGRIGLGLGLHIARDLVTRQGGHIWVTGAPDGGSIFNFTLPVYSEGCIADAEKVNAPRRRKTDRQLPGRPELLPAA